MEPICLNEQIQCVMREISMRQRVYPRLVINGKMTELKKAKELATMQEVCNTLLDMRLLVEMLKESMAALAKAADYLTCMDDLKEMCGSHAEQLAFEVITNALGRLEAATATVNKFGGWPK